MQSEKDPFLIMNILMNETLAEGGISDTLDFVKDLNNTAIFRKYEFVLTNPWTAYLSVIIVFVASVFGTVGNILTLLAIATYKRIRNEESLFFVNLAISDIYVTSFADPMSIIGMYKFCFVV